MSDLYIVAVALGPVGSFIGGGRRSRDLWFGSRFLSEVTRLAAYQLSRHAEVSLILPMRERIESSFLDDPEGLGRDRGPTISNQIICRVMAPERRVHELLVEARAEAHRFLADEVRKHKERLSTIIDPGQLERQAQAIQQGDFVEFYAAWVLVTEQASEELAIRQSRHLLAGRKAARLFPVPESEAGKPKCSLEAGWDSVLTEPDPAVRPRQAVHLFLQRQKLGIRPDERLSGVGLARRLAALSYTTEGRIGLPKLPFPPLSQVAADAWLAAARESRERPWLKDMYEQVHQRFRRLFDRAGSREEREACFVLASPSRRPGLRGDVEPDFDASIYFEGAIEAGRRELIRWCERHGVSRLDLQEHFTLLDDIEGPVRRLQEELGLPLPYFAMLEADGDGLGDKIEAARGKDRILLIEALYRFADRAWEVIDEHNGCAFYVGGDELAAYLPLDKVLPAVRKLGWLYDEAVGRHAEGTSLSAGIVVAHVHDDLRATRKHASDALKDAKRRRRDAGSDAGHLVIFDEPRAGARRPCGGPTEGVVRRLATCAKLLDEDRLSVSTAHAIRDLHDRLGRSSVGLDMGKAILHQKRRRSGMDRDGQADAAKLLDGVSKWDDLLDLAATILLATRISRVAVLRKEATP